jgi:hypothetical protein
MWEPRRITTLWASTAYYSDSSAFTFYVLQVLAFFALCLCVASGKYVLVNEEGNVVPVLIFTTPRFMTTTRPSYELPDPPKVTARAAEDEWPVAPVPLLPLLSVDSLRLYPIPSHRAPLDPTLTQHISKPITNVSACHLIFVCRG